MHVVRMRAYAWEISRKDMVGGKELKFLLLVLATTRNSSVLESVTGEGRCFRKLFGKTCNDCQIVAYFRLRLVRLLQVPNTILYVSRVA
jgi:hypothetical protein